MVKFLPIAALLAVASAGFYDRSPVMELDPSNFDSVVLTNDTSIVEFYAPWCGHCRNLQPEYVKAGRHLQDIAVVGAVNCDESHNKALCSKYRVEGFPTLLVFRPPKVNLDIQSHKKYMHATEIYSGPRKAKQIVEFVTDRMKNYTKRFATLKRLEEWAKQSTGRGKCVVLTQKDRLTPFLKSLAIDFLGTVDFAYLPLKREKTDVYSAFELEPDHDRPVLAVYHKDQWIKHNGELSKEGITKFLQKYTDVQTVADHREYKRLVMRGEKPKKKTAKKSKSEKDHDEL
jgi:protein disulfide-isomerase A6